MKNAILAIVKDHDEKAYWAPYLSGVSGLIGIAGTDSVEGHLSALEKSLKSPSLIIISSGVYSGPDQGLVEGLRKRCPESEFLLAVPSSGTLPPLEPLLRDDIRHIVINSDINGAFDEGPESSAVGLAIKKISEGGLLKLEDYLKPDTGIHRVAVSSSEQKESIIAGLERLVSGENPETELLRQKGALLADEMLENAMYGAPRGNDGGSLYGKGEKRLVLSGEGINFSYGFDGETLAMEVEDGWGSLSPRDVLEHLAKNQDGGGFRDDFGGRGLYIIWRFLDHMHIHISPGRQTVVGGQVRLMTADKFTDSKGFHITTSCAA